jgi:hypothetical protein
MIFREAFDPFRALGAAFRVFARSSSALLLGGFLIWLCDLAPQVGSQISQHSFSGLNAEHWQSVDQASREVLNAARAMFAGLTALLMGFACMLGIAAWLFRCFLLVGFARCVERTLTLGRAEPAHLFDARGRWVAMALTSLLCGIINVLAVVPGIAAVGLTAALVIAGTDSGVAGGVSAGLVALAYIPVAVYVWLGVALSGYAVALEGMDPTEAIARSWLLMRGHRWQLVWFWLVMTVPQVFCCLCCLLFLPAMIEHTAWVESYLRLVREGEPETWVKPPIVPAVAA